MSLFDGYIEPEQFEAGGGLLGRLMSLQQTQRQYQPSEGLSWPNLGGRTPQIAASPASARQTPDYGQTQDIRVGDYLMPQFGGAPAGQPAALPPSFGDRLGAAIQSWAHTPVGNPFAALANGISGFNSGQFAVDPAISQSMRQPSPTDSNGVFAGPDPNLRDPRRPRPSVRGNPPRPNFAYPLRRP